MKKLLFFILIVVLFSCKKEPALTLTGEWNVIFITHATNGTFIYDGVMSIIQNGNKLTGTFDWGGAVRPLLTNSNISDTVSIYCDNLLYSGTINKAYDLMSGGLYYYTYDDFMKPIYKKSGTWQAIRK
jgi:hypothetical protein